MADEYKYERIHWEDYPKTSTPLNAENLNKMDEAIEKAYERLDTGVIIDGNQPVQQNLMMYSGKGHTIEDSGINYRDVVIKTDLNNYATRTEMDFKAELSGEVHDNEVIIGSSPDVLVGSGVKITKLAQQTDYSNDILSDWNANVFATPEVVHGYQMGTIMFVHLVFRTIKAVDPTDEYDVGKLGVAFWPQHKHSFACAAINTETGTITTEGATLSPDGLLQLHLTKNQSSQYYLFDLNFFYCVDH